MQENLKSSNDWSTKGLGATDPDPDLKDKLMLFGQFVGDWVIIKARYLQSDGTWLVSEERCILVGSWAELRCRMFGPAVQKDPKNWVCMERPYDSTIQRLMLGGAHGSLPSRDTCRLS